MASLNFLERNLLVRGIREGKTFEEAAKALPLPLQKHPDLAKNWQEWAEAEAKKDDLAAPKAMKLDPDEFVRLRDENAKLREDRRGFDGAFNEVVTRADKLNSDLAAMRAKDEDASRQIVALTHERDNLAGEVRRLTKEVEEYVAQIEILSAPAAKGKK